MFQEMTPTERLRKDKLRRLIQEPEIENQDEQETVPEKQPMKDPEIEVLRRQIAALTEAMTRYQLHVHGDGSDDGENHYVNPFGRPPKAQRAPVQEQQHVQAKEEPKWEMNFKVGLPEFHGSLNPNEFMDWIHAVERVFDYHEVHDSRKVKLVAVRLRGRASAWWEQLQVQRVRRGKGKVQTWPKMKKLQEQFLPFNYTQSLYKSLHNLRQTRSVEEYAEAFYQLIARVDLNESEEQLVAKFVSGLKTHIQDMLCLHTCWMVSEAFNRALLIEKQQARRVPSYPSTSRSGTPVPNATKSWSQPAKKGEMGYNVASSSNAAHNAPKAPFKNQGGVAFKCFKCGEASHRAAECKKGITTRGKATMLDEFEVQEEEEHPVYDEEMEEEIGGDQEEEEGMALMIKKTLLTPKQEKEEDWVRSSLFHTTCNIGGRVCSLVIDGGSCENLVAEEVVEKLGLKTQPSTSL